ncbi:MAG: hypothetical protein WAP03_22955 [Methylorubrum rhodinum]|uniref:hypothetical protein n=1 Tax=Methylorubrum rhodinum TaxID=29428 RepID=UPI003BAEB270
MSTVPGLADAIRATAARIGANPLDLGTVMSYETAGTFDPWKAGPRTQWGQHRGLIQWGEPQARKYGVSAETPVATQVEAAGRYLQDTGFKPGMGIADLYSAINAGRVGRYNASDANNGGAPGTVLDKVRYQMSGHRQKAEALLGGVSGPPAVAAPQGQAPTPGSALADALPGASLPVFNVLPPTALADAYAPVQQAQVEQLRQDREAAEKQARRRALLSIAGAYGAQNGAPT